MEHCKIQLNILVPFPPIKKAKSKSEFERMSITKEKTGIDTYLKVINDIIESQTKIIEFFYHNCLFTIYYFMF